MSKKVFISHASADEGVVSLFVDQILVSGCGVQLDSIVYTSREDTGIANGEDIPVAIQDGIKDCDIFVMMISDNYRHSEVCLNEMGAAWMRDDLSKLLLLLPGVGFDKMGWLVSLKKGTRLTDSDGLDHVHDRIMEVTSSKVNTVTWNRAKAHFLSKLQENDAKEETPMLPVPVERQEEDELDFLDMREGFDEHTKAYTEIMRSFTEAMSDYGERIGKMARKLGQLKENPKSLTPAQVRGVFVAGAKDTDEVSELYEQQTPQFRHHFDKSIEFAEMLQQSTADEAVKEGNRKAFKEFLDSMVGTRDALMGFRKSLDEMPDLDKHFKKSRVRLKNAMDNMLDVVSFCISRATVML